MQQQDTTLLSLNTSRVYEQAMGLSDTKIQDANHIGQVSISKVRVNSQVICIESSFSIHCYLLIIQPTPGKMPSNHTEPTVQVNPPDLAEKTTEECLQLALAAINQNGFKKNGYPIFSFCEAANIYSVSKTTLTERFHECQMKTEAHKKKHKLSPACKEALVEWIKKMGHYNIPLHHLAVAAHAKATAEVDVSEAWVCHFCP